PQTAPPVVRGVVAADTARERRASCAPLSCATRGRGAYRSHRKPDPFVMSLCLTTRIVRCLYGFKRASAPAIAANCCASRNGLDCGPSWLKGGGGGVSIIVTPAPATTCTCRRLGPPEDDGRLPLAAGGLLGRLPVLEVC